MSGNPESLGNSKFTAIIAIAAILGLGGTAVSINLAQKNVIRQICENQQLSATVIRQEAGARYLAARASYINAMEDVKANEAISTRLEYQEFVGARQSLALLIKDEALQATLDEDVKGVTAIASAQKMPGSETAAAEKSYAAAFNALRNAGKSRDCKR